MIGLLAFLLLATPVHAQSDESAEERARALFREGEAAVERGEIARARELFDESVRVFPTTAAAFNSALTADELGDPVSALATVEALARGAFGAVPAERAGELRELHAGLDAKVGTIVIAVRGAEPSERTIDGTPVDRDEVRVAPGEHRVRVAAAGLPPQTQTISVGAGERRVAEFHFETPIAVPADEPPPAEGGPSDDDGGVFESPWFWIVLGALAIGGAAVAVGLVLAGDGLPEGNVFGERETLRF